MSYHTPNHGQQYPYGAAAQEPIQQQQPQPPPHPLYTGPPQRRSAHLNAAAASLSAPIPQQPQQQPQPVAPIGPPIQETTTRPPLSHSASSGRINASQMPSLVAVQASDRQRHIGSEFAPLEEENISENQQYFRASLIGEQVPPLPSTPIPILDDGNCSSRFIRTTTYQVPCSEEASSASKIPVALVIQPFADIDDPQRDPSLIPRKIPCVKSFSMSIPFSEIDASFSSPPLSKSSSTLLSGKKSPFSLILSKVGLDNSQDSNALDEVEEEGPIRCVRCRAFINCFVKFISQGRGWECNLCSMVNKTPSSYYCNLDQSNGKRLDLQHRPELCLASVDFLAGKDQILKKPLPPSIIFVLEGGPAALKNGSFDSSVHTIRLIIQEELRRSSLLTNYGKMAIITFDSISCQFYDFSSVSKDGSLDPKILVAPEIHDPFLPLSPEALFFSLNGKDGKSEAALSFLDRLSALIHSSPKQTSVMDSCLGAACQLAMEAVTGAGGGRVVIFASSPPTSGIGALKPRPSMTNSSSIFTTSTSDKINPMILPQQCKNPPLDFWSSLGRSAATAGVSFVLVATPGCAIGASGSVGASSPSMDLATISQIVRLTNGSLLYYPFFNRELHASKMVGDSFKLLESRSFVHDGLVRVRSGPGIQIGDYLGNICVQNSGTDCSLATVNSAQTFTVNCIYDGKLKEGNGLQGGSGIHFQVALLHTTSRGERRIRVHNLCLAATNTMSSIFRMADLDSYLIYACKKAINDLFNHGVMNMVSCAHSRPSLILAAYRKHCASTMPVGQLVLPESFKLLPLYCLALARSIFFGSHINIQTADSRVAALVDGMQAGLNNFESMLYYRMFSLLDWEDPAREAPQLRLSQEYISSSGIYLIDRFDKWIMFIGKDASSSFLSAIFGDDICSAGALNINSSYCLPNISNSPLNCAIRKLIRKSEDKRMSVMPLVIVRQGFGDVGDQEWLSCFIEDQMPSSPSSFIPGLSYVDFLCKVHSQINHEINNNSIMEKTAMLNFLQ